MDGPNDVYTQSKDTDINVVDDTVTTGNSMKC